MRRMLLVLLCCVAGCKTKNIASRFCDAYVDVADQYADNHCGGLADGKAQVKRQCTDAWADAWEQLGSFGRMGAGSCVDCVLDRLGDRPDIDALEAALGECADRCSGEETQSFFDDFEQWEGEIDTEDGCYGSGDHTGIDMGIDWHGGGPRIDAGPDLDIDMDIDLDIDADSDIDTDTDTDTDTYSFLTHSPMTECDGGVYDPESDLCWQDPPDTSSMTWEEASSHCLALGADAGAGIWRLPTISELRSLIRRGSAATCFGAEWDLAWAFAPAGYCGVRTGCLDESSCFVSSACHPSCYLSGPGSSGCYWDSALTGSCAFYWSSSSLTFNSNYAWGVDFSVASVDNNYQYSSYDARCVRDGT